MSTVLERYGARVADETLSSANVPSTDALLAGIGRKRRARARRRVVLTTVTATLIVLLGVFFGARWKTPAENVAARSAPALGVAHAELANVPLLFEDGTKIVVARGARAELKSVRKHGAELQLDDGTLVVDVVHTDESRWDVKAGPFGIRVTGTRFDATFDSRTKQLTIAMAEGTVMVSGPCVNEPLAAPAKKTFACETDVAPANIASPSLGTTTARELPDAPAPSAVVEARRPAPTPRWKSELDRGDARSAVASMTSSELDAALAQESASSLLALADGARLSGDGDRATKIYRKVRERFPRTSAAVKAAFLIGRMAEASSSRDEAARWYETVTREGQNDYAQESLGRLVELAQNRGDHDRARTLATEYLAKYPQGPHAAYASSVVSAHGR
jgi:hypothetical protein